MSNSFVARGHQIIAEAMAKAKSAEQAASKSQAVSTHVEACLRDLWNLMTLGTDATMEEQQAAEKQALADAEAAVVAEGEALIAPPVPVESAPPVPQEPAPLAADTPPASSP